MRPHFAAALFMLPLAAVLVAQPASAETCEETFARLVVEGNADKAPVRLTITTEMASGQVMRNYHYSDGNGDGMSEPIEPAEMPWSLFIGNNMYMSNDGGKSWSLMNTWDKEKQTADMKATMRDDLATATEISCGEDTLDGATVDTVEGSYNSTMLQGSKITDKFWLDSDTGKIVKKVGISDGAAGVITTTQIIEPWPDPVLPKPE